MVLPAIDACDGMQLARETQTLLLEQELLMSRFAAHGALAALNRIAGQEPAPVSPPLWDVLETCLRHHRLTDGAFDIAQAGRSGSRGVRLLVLDPATRTLRFDTPEVQLDLGGIGKGIALDAVRQRLLASGVDQALLSFGESSIAVIGKHPAADCWPVGVEDLFRPGRSLHRFALRDGAMSTSGNRAGQAHIVDPVDSRPIGGCRTVSVSCASATDAEALSTALFVLAPERRAKVLRHYPGAQAVEFDYLEHDGHWTVEKRWQYE
jgi:thiamine biosynthesis lipoprotein